MIPNDRVPVELVWGHLLGIRLDFFGANNSWVIFFAFDILIPVPDEEGDPRGRRSGGVLIPRELRGRLHPRGAPAGGSTPATTIPPAIPYPPTSEPTTSPLPRGGGGRSHTGPRTPALKRRSWVAKRGQEGDLPLRKKYPDHDCPRPNHLRKKATTRKRLLPPSSPRSPKPLPILGRDGHSMGPTITRRPPPLGSTVGLSLKKVRSFTLIDRCSWSPLGPIGPSRWVGGGTGTGGSRSGARNGDRLKKQIGGGYKLSVINTGGRYPPIAGVGGPTPPPKR